MIRLKTLRTMGRAGLVGSLSGSAAAMAFVASCVATMGAMRLQGLVEDPRSPFAMAGGWMLVVHMGVGLETALTRARIHGVGDPAPWAIAAACLAINPLAPLASSVDEILAILSLSSLAGVVWWMEDRRGGTKIAPPVAPESA